VDNLLQKLPRKWVVIDTYLIPRESANLPTLFPIGIREAVVKAKLALASIIPL